MTALLCASHQVQVRFATHKSHGKSLHVRAEGAAVVALIGAVVVVGELGRHRHVQDSDVDERPGVDSHSEIVVRAAHAVAACARACAAQNNSSVGQMNKRNIVGAESQQGKTKNERCR